MHRQNHIKILDVFENAIKTLPFLPEVSANVIKKNIKDLDYLDAIISLSNGRMIYERLVVQMAEQVQAKTVIVCIMSLSALYYKGLNAGFNVQPIKDAMLENESWLLERQIELLK